MGGVREGLHSISTSALNAEEWSTSRSSCFIPVKEAQQRFKWRMGEGGGLEVFRDEEISERNSNSSPSSPEHSSYTEWATAAPQQQYTATKFSSPKLHVKFNCRFIFMADFTMMPAAHVIQHRMMGWLWNGELKRLRSNAGRSICLGIRYSGLWANIINPYPTAFPYGNGMVLHFYQQQESSTTKTVHKVINKGLKTYV